MVKYLLPKLSFEYDSLEPFIDEQTMIIHHQKHHQTYVDGLNQCLEKFGGSGHPQYISSILSDLKSVPSEFAKKCLVNSGLKSKRATVIPESFMDSCVGDPTDLDISFETSENYLMFGQMSGDYETDRKNTGLKIGRAHV